MLLQPLRSWLSHHTQTHQCWPDRPTTSRYLGSHRYQEHRETSADRKRPNRASFTMFLVQNLTKSSVDLFGQKPHKQVQGKGEHHRAKGSLRALPLIIDWWFLQACRAFDLNLTTIIINMIREEERSVVMRFGCVLLLVVNIWVREGKKCVSVGCCGVVEMGYESGLNNSVL